MLDNQNYYSPTHTGVCPHCGHCPHCGRGGYGAPYNPYWSSYPVITCGTTQQQQTVTNTPIGTWGAQQNINS